MTDQIPVMVGIDPEIMVCPRQPRFEGLFNQGRACHTVHRGGNPFPAPVQRQGNSGGHFRSIQEMGRIPVAKRAYRLQFLLQPLQIPLIHFHPVHQGQGRESQEGLPGHPQQSPSGLPVSERLFFQDRAGTPLQQPVTVSGKGVFFQFFPHFPLQGRGKDQAGGGFRNVFPDPPDGHRVLKSRWIFPDIRRHLGSGENDQDYRDKDLFQYTLFHSMIIHEEFI